MPWFGTKVVLLKLVYFRLIVDHATLPGPPGFLSSTWCALYPFSITQEDVAVWPYSVNILLVFSSFLASLHGPQGNPDFGKFGISYFELLLMFELKSLLVIDCMLKKLFAPTSVPVDPWFFGFFSWKRARDPAWVSVSP